MKKVIPVIYALSIDEFNEKLNKMAGFSKEFQVDIMDGAFVPEKSFDIVDLESLPNDKDFEFHLMVSHPLDYIDHLKKLGVNRVVFHDEIDEDTMSDIKAFKRDGFSVFLAINPKTEPANIQEYVDEVDGILLMSVEPGRPGQELIPSVLAKAVWLRERHPNLIISMDGGINKSNIGDVFESGANIALVGSGILKAEDPAREWEELSKMSNI